MKTLSALVLSGFVAGMFAVPASGGSLVTSLGSLTENDLVNWGQLGPAGTALGGSSAPYSFTASFTSSSNGVLVGLDGVAALGSPATYGIPGTMLVVDNQFQGPVNIDFLDPVSSFGFYIASAFGGAFDVSISTYGVTSNLLQTYTDGSSSSPEEFFGVQDSTADIKSIAISMTNGNGNNYFAFGTLYAENVVGNLPPFQFSGVPEPSTWVLAGSALAVLIGLRRGGRKSRPAPTADRTL
jgi:hypothetical protein